MPQELMNSELLSSSTTLDVDAETDTQESLEFLRQLLRFLESRGTIGGDQVERLQRLFVQVRRFTFDHFDCHDAEGPDVDFRAVFFLLDDLRRHPVGCTDHGGTLGTLLCQLGAEAKIGNLDISSGREKDVVGLDVSMDDVLRVEVDESLASLCMRVSNVLWKRGKQRCFI